MAITAAYARADTQQAQAHLIEPAAPRPRQRPTGRAAGSSASACSAARCIFAGFAIVNRRLTPRGEAHRICREECARHAGRHQSLLH
jgi:hypothetical protein